MLYKGHLAAGAIISTTAAIIFTKNMPMDNAIGITLLSGVSSFATSLIPDLDIKSSKISRKIPIISIAKLIIIFYALYYLKLLIETNNIENFFIICGCIFLFQSLSHRKLLHSLIFSITLSAIIYKYIGVETNITKGIVMGLICGLFSHLIGDVFTKEGCPLFFPISKKISIAKFASGKDDKKIVSIIFGICLLLIIFCWNF